MNPSSDKTVARFAAVVLGMVNFACVGMVYAMFTATHQPTSASVATTSTSQVGSKDSTTNNDLGNASDATTATDGSNSTDTTAGQPATSGSSTPASGGSSAAPSTSSTSNKPAASTPTAPATSTTPKSTGSTTPSTPAAPAGLPAAATATGPPCKTSGPTPSGVCNAVYNGFDKQDYSQWDPTLISTMNAQVKAQSGGFVTSVAGLSLSLQESTWKAGTSTGTVKADIGAIGITHTIILTATWNGSKWIITTTCDVSSAGCSQ